MNPPPSPPSAIALWLPRADEHALAQSLGLVQQDAALTAKLIGSERVTLARDHPGVLVRVGRWHIWRVVRTLHRLGLTNTPDARAAAYTQLAFGHEHEAD